MSASSEDLPLSPLTEVGEEPQVPLKSVASTSKVSEPLDYPSGLIPLEPVKGPSSPKLFLNSEASANLPKKVFDTTLDMTFLSYEGDVTLFDRRAIALSLGADYMGRGFGGGEHYDPNITLLTRTLRKKFVSELELLNKAVVAQVVKFQDPPIYGFHPCGDYLAFAKRLLEIHDQIKDAGINLDTDMVWWGKEPNDDCRFWSANDYEILTVCYRYDVERFLSKASEFLNGKLQVVIPSASKGKQKEIKKDLPPHMDKGLTPEQEVLKLAERHSEKSDHSAEDKSFDAGLRNIKQRQSSLFAPRSVSLGLTGAGIFQTPNKITSARALSEMFEKRIRNKPTTVETDKSSSRPATIKDEDSDHDRPKSPPKSFVKEDIDPSEDPDSSDSDGDTPPPTSLPFRKPVNPFRSNSVKLRETPEAFGRETHFDLKLKTEVIPEWDGDPDTLTLWILKVNALSKRSKTVFNQLGQLIPTRLRKGAEAWYYSLPAPHRMIAEKNWETMRDEIGSYYMNRTWLDKQKMRARNAHYREANYSQEKPSDYYIRKTQLLSLAFNLSDTEVIMEVMNSAPSAWTSILTTHLYTTVVEFQTALKFHEDALIRTGVDERRRDYSSNFSRGSQFSNPKSGFRAPVPSSSNQQKAKAFAVGWTNTLGKPPFPKDDSNRTKRNKTPAQANARPCRHCGSSLHWDFECKYAVQGNKKARANSARRSEEYLQALDEYEELFYSSDLDPEFDFEIIQEPSEDEEESQDF